MNFKELKEQENIRYNYIYLSGQALTDQSNNFYYYNSSTIKSILQINIINIPLDFPDELMDLILNYNLLHNQLVNNFDYRDSVAFNQSPKFLFNMSYSTMTAIFDDSNLIFDITHTGLLTQNNEQLLYNHSLEIKHFLNLADINVALSEALTKHSLFYNFSSSKTDVNKMKNFHSLKTICNDYCKIADYLGLDSISNDIKEKLNGVEAEYNEYVVKDIIE